MSDSRPVVSPTFADVYTKQLDEKRRVSIPAKWRFKGDDYENTYMAMITKYNSIVVMPPDMTADFRQKISRISITNPQKRKALARLLDNSCTFGCDKQGRIMLKESILAKAQITKDVCLAGMGGTFEIWNPEIRKQWIGDVTPETEAEEASLLEEMGI